MKKESMAGRQHIISLGSSIRYFGRVVGKGERLILYLDTRTRQCKRHLNDNMLLRGKYWEGSSDHLVYDLQM